MARKPDVKPPYTITAFPVQVRMPGMPVPLTEGCPHRHGKRNSPDVCDQNEMRICIYESNPKHESCPIFLEIIKQWTEEYGYGMETIGEVKDYIPKEVFSEFNDKTDALQTTG